MADGVGFEPTEGFHLRRFSRPVLSTAQSPIRLRKFLCTVNFLNLGYTLMASKILGNITTN